MDLTGADVEVDVVVGHDAGVALRDAAHLERRRWGARGLDGHAGLDDGRARGMDVRAGHDGTARTSNYPEDRLAAGPTRCGEAPQFEGHVFRAGLAFIAARAAVSLACISG